MPAPRHGKQAQRPPYFRVVFLVLLGLLLIMPNGHTNTIAVTSTSPVRQLLLDNGLQLVWEEDHRQPLVAIEVRIKGGLRGEGPYVGTGITHFIEHLLFKGTTSRLAGTIDQEVRRYGGTINAFTSFDTTGISLFVESRYLPEALEMVADILQHTVFDPQEVEKERAVVISEIQMNLDDPDRRLQQLFWSRHYLEHPYRHPILGYQSLLEGITVQNLTAFYAAQYQPQNITVSCVGDVDGAAFPDLAKSRFGAWPRGLSDPSQQLVPTEPPSASPKEASLELPVQTAYAILGFSSTRLSDPELYPLDVLASILGHGNSSRLYERIVRQQQLAYAIQAWNYTPYDPGVFAVAFQTDPEKLEEATSAILAVLEEVKQRGVSEDELRKAKRTVTADYIFQRQTVEAKAGDLANSLVSTGDPEFSKRYVANVDRVTSDQVRAAAQRVCDPLKMTRAIIRPPVPVVTSTPPVQAEPMPVSRVSLSNGATTLIGVDSNLPIAAIVVAFRGGVRVEGDETQGLSNLVADMLTKGTKRRNAFQIAQYVESLGGTLQPFSGRDGFGVILQLLAQDLPQGIALMHELVSESTFPDQELAIQRQLILKELQTQEDEIFDVGGRLLRRTLFQRHPYRFTPLGAKETVEHLQREQCLAFANEWLAPSNTVVAVFGDVQESAVAQQLRDTFGTLPPRTTSWPVQLPEDQLERVRIASSKMDKEQALIMLGFRGSTYQAQDRYTLDVLTAVLSGMAGRLFQAVREEHGLSYTLGAAHVPGWDPGYLLIYAATRPEEQAKVLEIIHEQLSATVEKGFQAEEIDQAKRYLIGSNRMELQDIVGLAKRATLDELYGIGYDAWRHYEAKINAVTMAMVQDAAKRYLTLDRHAQIIVSPNGAP